MARLLKAFDLFCGAGGMSVGLRRAGFRVVGAVDCDAAACRAYSENHPDVAVWQMDVTCLPGKKVMKRLRLRRGRLDLLAACPPCQGFSTVRTKNGRASNRDPRNDLVFEVLRFARVMRPKAIMLENVPGLAKNRRFHAIRRELKGLGYAMSWSILDAADYGVPQRRRRLVLLASLLREPSFAPACRARHTVRDAIAHLTSPGKSRDPLHRMVRKHSRKVARLIRSIPKDGGSRAAIGHRAQLACHRRVRGFYDVYGRMAWDKPAPTITSGCTNPSRGRFLHPVEDRALSLREAALLQSFPRRYRFPTEFGQEALSLLVGNALPPEFIRRHAASLIRRGAV